MDTTTLALIAAIDACPGEITPILELADRQEELGHVESAALLRAGMGFLSGYGDGYGGGDGYGDGYGDGGDGDGDGGDGDGYGDGGDGDGYGDGGDGYGDGDGFKLSRGFAVESGLYIICSPGGYYPYVRVGWCERHDIMIAVRNCRVIKRFGTDAELATIAESGPLANTKLLKAAKLEYVSVGMVSRLIACDPESWAEECPRPKQKRALLVDQLAELRQRVREIEEQLAHGVSA